MEPIKDFVSVVIPTYNRAHLIKRSAMSVLNQTYSNLELIIVDDGSTDNTEDVVKSINDNRVIYIKQSNQGACAARNNGIDHAKGEFIAFQDSDDVWHEDKLEKQLKCLKETGADICFCAISLNKSPKNKKMKSSFVSNIKDLFNVGVQRFFAKYYVFKSIKFDTEMPRCQDLDILLRISNKYKIYELGEPLVDYYIQNDSLSKSADKLFLATSLLIKKHKCFQDPTNYNLLLSGVLNGVYYYQNELISGIYGYGRIPLRLKFRLIFYRIGLFHFCRFIRDVFKNIFNNTNKQLHS